MKSSPQNINRRFKNSLSFNVLKKIVDAQKIFIDKPTNSNLDSLLETLNEYNQAWIDDATNNRTKASSLELQAFFAVSIGVNQGHVDESSLLSERVMNNLKKILTPLPTPSNPEPGPLSEIRVMNKVLNKWTNLVSKANSADRIAPGANNSSSIEKSNISLITSHTYVPYEIIYYLNNHYLPSGTKILLDPPNPSQVNLKTGLATPLNFHAIKIACSRIASKGYTPSDAYQRSIRTNRRWYIEQNKAFDAAENKFPLAWMEDRNKVENLFNYDQFNDRSYDDPRISKYSIFDSSGNLLNRHHIHNPSHKTIYTSSFLKYEIEAERLTADDFKLWANDELLSEVSLSTEEHFTRLPGLKFAIFESSYCKTPRQFIEMNKSGLIPKWRDILIYNDDFITLRSFTDDRRHVPKIKESRLSFDHTTWYLSNEMPEMSNQAFRFFKSILDADVIQRVSVCRKLKMSEQQISKSIELESSKWMRILNRPSPSNLYTKEKELV
jgi:hypothetical protein